MYVDNNLITNGDEMISKEGRGQVTTAANLILCVKSWIAMCNCAMVCYTREKLLLVTEIMDG